MALTASETFGTIVPGFVTDTNGNLSCTATVSGSSWREGFLRDTDGRLVVTDSATGATWQNGFLRGTSGELVYTLNSGDYGVVPGFKTATNGALCFSVEPSSQAWQNGFLVSTSGYLAATGVTPYAVAVRALSPSFFLSLGSQAGLTDLSGNGRNGTGAGSITIGGQTGPLVRGDGGATLFDGTDDRITTAYSPYVNGSAITVSGWADRSDPAPSELYMPTPSALDTWKSIRSDTLAGSRQAHVSIVGDSIAFGAASNGASTPKYENCWPGQLRTLVDARFGSAGTGIVLADENLISNPTWDDRWAWNGGVVNQGFGLFRQSCFRLDGASSQYVEFTAVCDEFEVMVLNDTAGFATVSVDGGATQTIRNITGGSPADLEPEAGNHPKIMVTKIPAGSVGSHTLRIYPPSSSSSHDTFLCWADGRINVNKRFRISNLSNNGESLSTLGATGVNNDETNGLYGLPHLDTANADLQIIGLGINDWQGAMSVSSLKSALVTLIERQRSSGTASGGGNHANGDAMLLWNPQPNVTVLQPGGGPTWQQYRDAFYEVADEQNCALLDLGMTWGGFDAANTAGYFADNIHPSDTGAALIAAKVQRAVFGDPSNRYLVAGSGSTSPVIGFQAMSDSFLVRTDFTDAGTSAVWDDVTLDGHWSVVLDQVNELAFLYLNGELVGSKALTGDYNASPGNFQIGSRNSTSGAWDGTQSWVSVHERALTADEIAGVYAAK